ncbi:hypothetical protein DPMN_080309 [Dreissena polymorpha]|uniref:Uncharacterized protein n=1 Tax=Dreissena polymorpha TaxID=45954 RepID=A0A9D4BRT8_DREPO|nr:hypothetical protein DPMN_080309 [Dreissena polymorpha]
MARQGPTRLVMWPCIVEIDRITILGGCGLIWAGRPRIDRIVIRDVQYQFEVNRCRNEEIIVNSNFGGVTYVGGAPQVEIDLNRCRNEEIVVKGNFGWAWPIWAGTPWLVMGPCIVEIDRIVIREVQYQFEAILGGRGLCGRGAPGLVMGPCIVEIDRIVIREVQYQFEVNWCRDEEVNVK